MKFTFIACLPAAIILFLFSTGCDCGRINLIGDTDIDSVAEDLSEADEAQPVTMTWARTYGSIYDDEEALSVLQTLDGEYIVTGIKEWEGGMSASWIMKLDPSGNEIWGKIFDGDYNDNLSDIRQTSDGNFLLCGHSTVIRRITKSWVLKLDEGGNILWNKVYGQDDDNRAHAIELAQGHGILIAGRIDFPQPEHINMIITMLDENGDSQWSKNYGGVGWQHVESLVKTNDGGFMAIGAISFNSGVSDCWAVKLDREANIEWQKLYASPEIDQGHALQQTSDGGYILGGGSDPYGPEDRKPKSWILKLDANGNIQWQKSFGKDEIFGRGIRSVRQTSDGGYVMVGNASTADHFPEFILIIKTDANGNVMWQRSYGRSENATASDVQETSDGGFIVVGKLYSTESETQDVWILKLDENGNLSDSCPSDLMGYYSIEESDFSLGSFDATEVAAPWDTVTTSTADHIDFGEFHIVVETQCEG